MGFWLLALQYFLYSNQEFAHETSNMFNIIHTVNLHGLDLMR